MVAESLCRGQVIHGYKGPAPTQGVHEEWHCTIIAVEICSAELANVGAIQSYSQFALLF